MKHCSFFKINTTLITVNWNIVLSSFHSFHDGLWFWRRLLHHVLGDDWLLALHEAAYSANGCTSGPTLWPTPTTARPGRRITSKRTLICTYRLRIILIIIMCLVCYTNLACVITDLLQSYSVARIIYVGFSFQNIFYNF